MKILLLHNRYRQQGGEDSVVISEIELLRANGITVFEHELCNDPGEERSRLRPIQIGWRSDWSSESYRRVADLCNRLRPNLAHVHNFWMRWSPSVHAACQDSGVPTVQTLHNFRLLCPNAAFLRNGRVCEDCLGKIPWRGVVHRCYRDSFAASGLVARMIMSNRRQGTWAHQVNAFIALSEHSRKKFLEAGFESDKLWVKPNFLEDHQLLCPPPSSSNAVLFVGRFAEEKGVDTLLRAWAQLPNRSVSRLLLIGDGPLRTQLQQLARNLQLDSEQVKWLGSVPQPRVMEIMSKVRAVVLPSICYENCPRTVIEAYCLGRPVIGSRIGAVDEFVHHGDTGLKATAGDPLDLANALFQVLRDAAAADQWGTQARREYLTQYTPTSNFRVLKSIYDSVLTGSPAREATASTATR